MHFALLFIACTLLVQDKYEAKQLLGKWEADNTQPGLKVTVEFHKEDKIEISIDFQGKQQKAEGKYKLEAESLTFIFNRNGKDNHHKNQVIKLTNKELIIKDADKGEEQVFKKLP